MSDNPYAPVESLADPAARASSASLRASGSLLAIARDVFLAWEKLRVVYIASLAIPTLLLVVLSSYASLSLVFMIGLGAVFSNVCFMAGPILETYIRWLGYQRLWPRFAMFIGGTMLTLLAAMISVSTFIAASR